MSDSELTLFYVLINRPSRGLLARLRRFVAVFESLWNLVCGDIFGRIGQSSAEAAMQQAVDENNDRETQAPLQELLRLIQAGAKFDAVVLRGLAGTTGDSCVQAVLQRQCAHVANLPLFPPSPHFSHITNSIYGAAR